MSSERLAVHRLFYGGVTVTLGLLLWGWWAGSAGMLAAPGGRLIVLGRLFGLLATYAILLEVLLMSRVPFLERHFDLHEMMDLHRWTGYTILGGITAHLVFLVLGYAAPGHVGLWRQFLDMNIQYEDVFKATLGTIIFVVAAGLSVQFMRRRLPYEWWFAAHLTLYGAILLTALHQLKTGGDFVGHFWFTAYWYMWFIGVFGLLAWYRFIVPLLNAWRHQFQVAAVVREAQDTYSVYVTGRDIEKFRFEPGQYATWWILAPGMWWQGHPFSFSGASGGDSMRFTAKVSGDFSNRIARIKPGTRMIIDGPRGSFTTDRAYDSSNVVLVAGGIGVSPYLATIRTLLEQGKTVTLLYAARSAKYVTFVKELKELERSGLHVRLFMQDQAYQIDRAVLESFIQTSTTVYLCGPDGMTRELTAVLKGLGLPKQQIIAERFAF